VYERRKSKIVIVILFDGGKDVRRPEWPRLNMLQRGKSMSEARFRPRGLWLVAGASQQAGQGDWRSSATRSAYFISSE
jgi:hypothetical protein